MRTKLFAVLGVVAMLAGLVMVVSPGGAADHFDAPLVVADGRTDLNDLFVFQSPENPDNTVLIMTVNPLAGVVSPTTFDPGGTYRFLIDTDGDAKKDEKITVKFGKVASDGTQSVKIRGAAGKGRGRTGTEIGLDDGGRFMANTFDDPFFFDAQAFMDQIKGAGGPRTFNDGNQVDFFAGLNVSGIVIEVPTNKITGNDDADDDDDSNIGVWAETKNENGRADRLARPVIAVVLIDDGSEDRFNRTRPHRDRRRFGDQVVANLLFLSGLDGSPYTEAEAQAVTDVLLPDILTIDLTNPAQYLNGRRPADDVIDTSLGIATGGFFGGSAVLTTDGIDANDVPFPGTFPYLAPAH